MIDIDLILGLAGMMLIVLSYFLLSSGKLRYNSIIYQSMNFFGGLGVLANTFVNKAWPTAALNLIFSLIALTFVIRIIKSGKHRGL